MHDSCCKAVSLVSNCDVVMTVGLNCVPNTFSNDVQGYGQPIPDAYEQSNRLNTVCTQHTPPNIGKRDDQEGKSEP